ncbi:histone methyltransferase [Chloropicon primus]|nr:histone methyltransferase [Chloropicon primus]UPR04942.1 histone methyltransferase [Chloropicon primus]|eukprot:QDZ25746.1 histone methyltransferase [Chloropicon primus]
MFVECDPKWCACGEQCENTRFQRRKYADVSLMPPTGPKGYGLRTNVDLAKGDFVMEYVGEVIDEEEHARRKVEYREGGRRHFYFMSIANGELIDATKKGNLSRFLNHSCEPNCETQKWQVNGELCIGVFALKDVKAGGELTFDYHFENDAQQTSTLKCLCGEPNCRGFIGSKAPQANQVNLEPESSSSLTNYNPARDEPAPEFIVSKHVEDEFSHIQSSSSNRRRLSSSTKVHAAVRGQTEVERILDEVTTRTGVLKSEDNALDLLRIMHSNHSQFEIGLMFDVVLRLPTRSLREAFIRHNILGKLQVMMNRFRTEEDDKKYLPLLRKALDITASLPLSKERISKAKTAKCDFATFLIGLVDHTDAMVASKAQGICDKHLSSELHKELSKKQEQERSRRASYGEKRWSSNDGNNNGDGNGKKRAKRPREDYNYPFFGNRPGPPPPRPGPPRPPPRPAADANPPASTSNPPASASNDKASAHKRTKNFKDMDPNYVWKDACDRFKAVVREVIDHRVKGLAKHKVKALYKDKKKMETIINKLFRRVLEKEVQKFEKGGKITVHKDLVSKVDKYTRAHLKNYDSSS